MLNNWMPLNKYLYLYSPSNKERLSEFRYTLSSQDFYEEQYKTYYFSGSNIRTIYSHCSAKSLFCQNKKALFYFP